MWLGCGILHILFVPRFLRHAATVKKPEPKVEETAETTEKTEGTDNAADSKDDGKKDDGTEQDW